MNYPKFYVQQKLSELASEFENGSLEEAGQRVRDIATDIERQSNISNKFLKPLDSLEENIEDLISLLSDSQAYKDMLKVWKK